MASTELTQMQERKLQSLGWFMASGASRRPPPVDVEDVLEVGEDLCLEDGDPGNVLVDLETAY